MAILYLLGIGLLAGWITALFAENDDYGCVADVIGIVGALIGGFVGAGLLGLPMSLTGLSLGTAVVSFLSAVTAIGVLCAPRALLSPIGALRAVRLRFLKP